MPDTIPVFELAIYPGWLSTYDSPSLDATGGWIYPQSPTTPYNAPNGKPPQRYLLLDPRYTDSAGRKGNDEWWFIVERFWPTDYHPDTSDRDPNWHNAPGDAGNSAGAPGGIGWAPNFGSGVSGLAADYGVGGPEVSDPGQWLWRICLLCAWRSQGGFDAPIRVKLGEWNTIVIYWVAGRTDGSTVRPGEVTVWLNGADTPVLDRKNINTVQRAKSPADGQMYTQRWMTFWEGAYTIHLKSTPYKKQIALTRMGKTLAEALADRPTKQSDNFGSLYRAYGSYPRSTLTELAGRDPAAARIPKSLGGNGGGNGGSTPVDDFGWTPENPKVGQIVTFTVKEPRTGVKYEWDRTLDGVPEGEGTTHTYAYQSVGTKTVTLYADGRQAARHSLDVAAGDTSPPDPIDLRILSQDTKTITLGWTPPAGQEGYLPTIDGSDKMTDGKRHPGTSETANSVRIGKKQDGQKHRYGVQILGKIVESSVEA